MLFRSGKRVQWATWWCNQIRGAPRSFVKFRDGTWKNDGFKQRTFELHSQGHWIRRLGLLNFTISESGYNGQRGGLIRSAEHRVVLLNFRMEPEKMTF